MPSTGGDMPGRGAQEAEPSGGPTPAGVAGNTSAPPRQFSRTTATAAAATVGVGGGDAALLKVGAGMGLDG